MTDANRPQEKLTIEQRTQQYVDNIIKNAVKELQEYNGQTIADLHAHIEKTIQRYRQALNMARHGDAESVAVRQAVLSQIGNPKTLPAFYDVIINEHLDIKIEIDTKKGTGIPDLDKALADLANWTPTQRPSAVVAHPKFLKEENYAFLLLDKTKIPAEPFSPKEVAKNIFAGKADDVNEVGKFLGEINPDTKKPDAFIQAVLAEYAKLSVKSGVSFPDALRSFLDKFKLPGEAKQIDRIMECFAKQYHEQNKNQFPSQDDAFRTAFATIMLATDLHSTEIKTKMTKEQFVKNTGQSFDRENSPDKNPTIKTLLEEIYVNIQAKPLALKSNAPESPQAKQPSATPASTPVEQAIPKIGLLLKSVMDNAVMPEANKNRTYQDLAKLVKPLSTDEKKAVFDQIDKWVESRNQNKTPEEVGKNNELKQKFVNILAKDVDFKQKNFSQLLDQWKNLSTLQTAYLESNRSKFQPFNIIQSKKLDKISDTRNKQLLALTDAATKAIAAYQQAQQPKHQYDYDGSDPGFKKRAEQTAARTMLGAIGNLQEELKKEPNHLGSRLDKMLIEMETQMRASVMQPNIMDSAKKLGMLEQKQTEHDTKKSPLYGGNAKK